MKNLVMLAALETVPGTKSMLFSMSAFPVAPTHVPLLSLMSNDIPGRPLRLYFSRRDCSARFLGCNLLLSDHGVGPPIERVCMICGFLHDKPIIVVTVITNHIF